MNNYVKREYANMMFNRYFEMVEKMYKVGECDAKTLQLVLDMKQAFFELPATTIKKGRDCTNLKTLTND